MCIPREKMPQVQDKDYPFLFDYLRELGVNIEFQFIDKPGLKCYPKQCLAHYRELPLEKRLKPVLLSQELAILDGNHRWRWHATHDRPMQAFILGQDFDRALSVLRAFPGAYYKDTHNRPVHYQEANNGISQRAS